MKLGLFLEEDDKGELTGRWQVANEDLDEVFDTFDTEEEAKAAMIKMQVELDRDDEIEKDYLKWEKDCLSRHAISQEELRVLLVNSVMV